MDLAKILQMLMQRQQQPQQFPDLSTGQYDDQPRKLEDLFRQMHPGVMNNYEQGIGGGDYESYKQELLRQELRRRMMMLQLKGQM